jgi:hypothetical protein
LTQAAPAGHCDESAQSRIAQIPLGVPGEQYPVEHIVSVEQALPALAIGMHPVPFAQYVVASVQPQRSQKLVGAMPQGVGTPLTQA